MFKKIDWKRTWVAAIAAGIAFCIPVFFFIRVADYTDSSLLYLGNFFFLVVSWIHILQQSKQQRANNNTVAFVFNSHATVVLAIMISCIGCFILLSLMIPGYLQPGMTEKTLIHQPANLAIDKTGGLSLQVFMSATIINFCVGSFSSIILPFYTKRKFQRQ